MIKGIGCDIVEIARVKKILVAKILSGPEWSLYETFTSDRRKQEFLAGRFAVKEALIKALDPKDLPIPFPELVILNDETGKPYVAGERWKNRKITVTLAHEKAYAVAFCVVEDADL